MQILHPQYIIDVKLFGCSVLIVEAERTTYVDSGLGVTKSSYAFTARIAIPSHDEAIDDSASVII